MARFLNKASSSLLRSLAAAEQEYKNGIFMSSSSQFCNFSSKAKQKSKSGAGSLTKEDAALQPALSKSKSKPKTKSSAGSLPKGDIALKPTLPKSKAKSKSGAGDLAKQDMALQLSLSKSKAKSGAGKLPKEDIALQQALDKISASFGKGAIMWLGRQDTPKTVPVVSTGSFALDMALGIGGLPKGRVVEVYGPEASGKTTLALHVIAEAQKQGGVCAFFHAGHTLDPGLAEAIGVNTKNLLLSLPDSCEQALSLVDTLVRSGSVKVVVVDSVPPVHPEGELGVGGEMGNLHMAVQARLMSQLLRRLSHSLSLSQTILIFVNEVTSHQEVSSLGTALKFYASVRLNMKRIGLVQKREETVGSQVLVNVVKNKHAPPFKAVQFELEFGKGISREGELLELGCKHELITKPEDGVYSFNDQSFLGKDDLKNYLAQNVQVREELVVKLREKVLPTDANDEEAAEA
ncbi:hypothetical protein MKW98_019059 [Papaver atlanticum]|uniref:Uncharacterized protein n=1 Tax=Papaver atlanticum TaxID=357466 RepID=A0AAD4TJE7_9MAGN|nr:hypothetical protein MKW98_019059 [Papaver atlanticum]